MCGAHATVRGFLGGRRNLTKTDVLVDMEAGLEHLSRGTGRHVSRFLAVVEPYYRSMETARRIAQLAGELGVTSVDAVINKVRDEADREAVHTFCVANKMPVVAEIPYDTSLVDAERAGRPALDFTPDAPSVTAIRRLADHLLSTA